jgi:hypothetical protein
LRGFQFAWILLHEWTHLLVRCPYEEHGKLFRHTLAWLALNHLGDKRFAQAFCCIMDWHNLDYMIECMEEVGE